MFSIRQECGQARTGVFTTSHGIIETPGMLIRTSRGMPVNLTPDHLSTLRPEARALGVCAVQFVDNPKPETVKKAGGAHKFLGLEEYVLVMGLRDAVTFECGVRNASKRELVVNTPQGVHKVTPAAYMDLAEALRPDVVVGMSDEMVFEMMNPKRARGQMENTMGWLDALLERRSALGLDKAMAVLGPVAGPGDPIAWARSAEEVAQRAVDGFVVAGLGLGEQPEERPRLLSTAVESLPPGKVRMVQGLGAPLDVLAAVSAGLDLFDSAYASLVSRGGYALVFPVSEGAPPRATGGGNAGGGAAAGGDAAKINLRAVAYAKDTRPILEGCECLACKQHSRAYLHHLLNAHEMLVEAMLELHNTHHMLRFFQAVRGAIAGGRLGQYRAWFEGQVAGAGG